MVLPEDWSVTIGGAASPGAWDLDPRASTIQGGQARAFLADGWARWGMEKPRSGVRVLLAQYPNLDAIWTLYMGVADDPHEGWDAICRYVADVEQGFVPDRVAPEISLQGIFLALAESSLPADPDRFVSEALALCETVDSATRKGANLLLDPVLEGRVELARYTQRLERDRALYVEDRERGEIFRATVPAPHGGEGPRDVLLLVLRNPLSVHFKLWARADITPAGEGFPLLLVVGKDGEVVLTADPARKLRVGWLAEPLSAAETAAGGAGDVEWYDGGRHGGTLVANPHGGTALSEVRVTAVLRGQLRLRSTAPEGLSREVLLLASLTLAACLLVVALMGWVSTSPDPAIALDSDFQVQKPEPPRAYDLPASRSLLAKADGPRGVRRFAVVAGACAYPGRFLLERACDDAVAVHELLVSNYGYNAEDTRLLIDRGTGDDSIPPTAKNMQRAFEQIHEQIRVSDSLNSFLFYFSGHGYVIYEPGGAGDQGYIAPTGFHDDLSEPMRHALATGAPLEGYSAGLRQNGWEMQDIRQSARLLGAAQTLLVLDACHSGMVIPSKGAKAQDFSLHDHWDRGVEEVLTSSSRDELSYEGYAGTNSVFTMNLLNQLDASRAGLANGDMNADGAVSVQELYTALLQPVVHQSKAAGREATPQHPELWRSPHSKGQFLFIRQSDE